MNKEHLTERLYLIAPRRLAWINEKLPPLGPQDVLIQTYTAAISIGSELPQYRGNARASHTLHYPYSMGYESVGIVTECGSAVQKVRCGDRVVAFYGHSTYAVVPETKVIAVPPKNQSIPLLAQNTAPEFKCIVCGKAATQVKMEDVRNSLADATYCNACAEDQYEEDMRPLINSPRVGAL